MANKSYNAGNLSVLEGLDAVRKRPGMYIGSKDSKGFMHCIYEIVDNSVDEALAGYCSEINIILHNENSFEVIDNGRGIPVDIEKSTKMSGVELVLTKLHAGGKFSDENYNKVGGLHGVGSSVVNALSSKMVATIYRDGNIYQMEFSKGQVGTFDTAGKFTKSTSKINELKIVGKCEKTKTGTSILFELDREIFPMTSKFIFEALNKRLTQTSFLVPKLKINLKAKEGFEHLLNPTSVNNNQEENTLINEDTIEETLTNINNEKISNIEYYSENGIPDFVDSISDGEPISEIWSINGVGSFDELTQSLDDSHNLQTKTTKREVDVDISFRWVNNYEQKIESYVNIISTPFGGSHYDGFIQALVKVIRNKINENARKYKFKPGEEKIEKDDILAGFRGIIAVKLPEPQFEGQTKETLGTLEVKPIVTQIVSEKLEHMFSSGKKEYKEFSTKILEKIVAEMKARIGAKKQKDMLRKKANIESAGSMPSKLVDCGSNNADETELFIVEGDSALGTAKLARNSNTQALLPIRGKILNVQKASLNQMLSNAECSSIIQVIGAGSSKSFDISLSRYSKVIFMTDADVDGAHIRILLLTLFYNYLPEMISKGKVYSAVPPLHRIELMKQPKDSMDKYIYTYSEEELVKKLEILNNKNIAYKDDIQRYKGLGEMDADQLADTTMDPSKRLLRKVEMPSAEEAANVFELLMGDEVPPRKQFIIDGADRIDRENIDA